MRCFSLDMYNAEMPKDAYRLKLSIEEQPSEDLLSVKGRQCKESDVDVELSDSQTRKTLAKNNTLSQSKSQNSINVVKEKKKCKPQSYFCILR